MDFQKVSGSTNQEEERLKKWEVVKILAKMASQRTWKSSSYKHPEIIDKM